MGSTTRYGITYPELSAVPNAPSQMQTMANTIDTALGTAVDNVAGLTAGRTDQLMNGNFLINQRAASSYTASAASGKYTVDRWYLSSGTGASNTVTPTAETLGTYADHDRYYLEWDRTTAGSADSYLEQRIEGVRTGNGTSITVAILADVASSTANLKVEVVQNFGTGGSPSTAVTTTSTALTISTSNTAQYKTISIPSISGKTIGSNGDDYVAIRLTRESGYGTGKIRLHRVGATLGTAQVWPDKRPKQQELALCYRYCRGFTSSGLLPTVGIGSIALYSDANSFSMITYCWDASTFRTAPTMSFTGSQGTDWAVRSAAGVAQTGFTVSWSGGIYCQKTSHGLTNLGSLVVLTGSGRIVFDAEL